MQFTVMINQAKALEWGLNSQQAILFAFVYTAPSWARIVETHQGVFFELNKSKIVDELPLLTDKPDTAYRLLKALQAAGLVELSSTRTSTLVRLTAKAAQWNRRVDGSENYPTPKPAVSQGRWKKIRARSENNPTQNGKKSDLPPENSPTDQLTNNQYTNQGTSQSLQPAAAMPPPTATGEGGLALAPRCTIPDDMPGPKDATAKTYRAWANYAMAYRRRYSTWPVWNAKVAGQVGRLVDRLGTDVAHQVAAYYLTINDARVVNGCHAIGELLLKAEAYHTQWATGRQITSVTAQQIERKQANFSAGAEAARRILENAGGQPNEFL